MNTLHKKNSAQKGEIATLLTVATFALMVAGVLIGNNLGNRTTTDSQAAGTCHNSVYCNRDCTRDADICRGGTTCMAKKDAYGTEGSAGQKKVCWNPAWGNKDPQAKLGLGERGCKSNSECDTTKVDGKDVQLTCKNPGHPDGGTCEIGNDQIPTEDRAAKAACKTQTGNEANWQRGTACSNLCTPDTSCNTNPTSGTFSCNCGAQKCWNKASQTCEDINLLKKFNVSLGFKGKITSSISKIQVTIQKQIGGNYVEILSRDVDLTRYLNSEDQLVNEVFNNVQVQKNAPVRLVVSANGLPAGTQIIAKSGQCPNPQQNTCIWPTPGTVTGDFNSVFDVNLPGSAGTTKTINGRVVLAGGKPTQKVNLTMNICQIDTVGNAHVCNASKRQFITIDPATYNPDEWFKPFTFGSVTINAKDTAIIELQTAQLPTGAEVRILDCPKEQVGTNSYKCIWEGASSAPNPLEQNFQVVFPEESGEPEIVKTKTIKGTISWTGQLPIQKFFKLMYNCSVGADNGLTCAEQKWVTPDVTQNSVDYIIPNANVGGDDNRIEIALVGFNNGSFPTGTTVTAPGCPKQGRYPHDCLIERIHTIGDDIVQDFDVAFPDGGACNFAAVAQITDKFGNPLDISNPSLWKYSNNKGGTESFRDNFRSAYVAQHTSLGANDPVISDGKGVTYKRGEQLSWTLQYDPVQYKLLGNNIRECDFNTSEDGEGVNCTDKSNTSGNLTTTTSARVDCGKKIVGGWWFEKMPPTPTPELFGDLKVVVAGYQLGTKAENVKNPKSCDLGYIQSMVTTTNKADKGKMQWFSNQWGYEVTVKHDITGKEYKATTRGSDVNFSKIPVGKYNIDIDGTNMEFVEMAGPCTDDVEVGASAKYGVAGAFGTLSSGTTTTHPVILIQDKNLTCDTRTTCDPACKNPGELSKDFKGECGPAQMCCRGDAGGNSGGRGCEDAGGYCKVRPDGTPTGGCDPTTEEEVGNCSTNPLIKCCKTKGTGGPGGGSGGTGGKCSSQTCMYSQNNKCYRGTCLDGSNNCSTNQNCGYVSGCGVSPIELNCSTGAPLTGGGTGGAVPPPPAHPRCDNAGGTCTNLGSAGCQAEGGSYVGKQDCGGGTNTVCCKFPEAKAECKSFGSTGGECKPENQCNNSTHTNVGRYGCSFANNICCVKRPTREAPPSTGNTTACRAAGGGCTANADCRSAGGTIVAPGSCSSLGAGNVCCKVEGVTPPPAGGGSGVVGEACPAAGHSCSLTPGGGRVACKTPANTQGYCCPSDKPDWNGSQCYKRGAVPPSPTGAPVPPPGGGDLSCVPPAVAAKLSVAYAFAYSQCNLIPDIDLGNISYSCTIHKESGPDNDKYVCDIHSEGAFDWNPGACLDAISAIGNIIESEVKDAACRAVIYASGVYKGCVNDGASAVSRAKNELDSALNNKIKNTVLWGDVDVSVKDACINPPAKTCSGATCLATEGTTRIAACVSTINALKDRVPPIWNAMKKAASSCRARVGFLDAGVEIENNSGKAITQVEVSVCDKNGVCEKRIKNVSIKPGQKGDVRESITKVEQGDDINSSYTVSCKIKYEDGTTADCPSKQTRNDSSVNMKLETTTGGRVTGKVASTLELADCDKDKRVTTLDFTRTVNQYGKTGANVCDTDLNEKIDALDLSNIIRHLDQEVPTFTQGTTE